jgi:hypothetical protein
MEQIEPKPQNLISLSREAATISTQIAEYRHQLNQYKSNILICSTTIVEYQLDIIRQQKEIVRLLDLNYHDRVYLESLPDSETSEIANRIERRCMQLSATYMSVSKMGDIVSESQSYLAAAQHLCTQTQSKINALILMSQEKITVIRKIHQMQQSRLENLQRVLAAEQHVEPC